MWVVSPCLSLKFRELPRQLLTNKGERGEWINQQTFYGCTWCFDMGGKWQGFLTKWSNSRTWWREIWASAASLSAGSSNKIGGSVIQLINMRADWEKRVLAWLLPAFSTFEVNGGQKQCNNCHEFCQHSSIKIDKIVGSWLSILSHTCTSWVIESHIYWSDFWSFLG